MTRLETAADLERAYIASFDAVHISVNTEGVVTARWPDYTMQREFLLEGAPAPVAALLDAM